MPTPNKRKSKEPKPSGPTKIADELILKLHRIVQGDIRKRRTGSLKRIAEMNEQCTEANVWWVTYWFRYPLSRYAIDELQRRAQVRANKSIPAPKTVTKKK